MSRLQIATVGGGVLLFLTLYFGCDTKIRTIASVAPANASAVELADAGELIENAKKGLNPEQTALFENLEGKIKAAADKDIKIAAVKSLSGALHNDGKEEAAAIYAEEAAALEKTESAWSIAGGNFYIALQKATDPKIRNFCSGKAIEDFENAASLNPRNLDHKINIALCYAENPPPENPMKATLMLLDLLKSAPDNMNVPIQLARLAIKTGQYDRAIFRLTEVLKKEPENNRAICLLAEVYQVTNNPKAAEYEKKCGNNHQKPIN